MACLVNNLLIIGTGLIGGSFAKGLKTRQQVVHVAGFSRNFALLEQGVEAGVIDEAVVDLEAAIEKADVIFLSVPTLAIKHYLTLIDTYKKAGAVVTDAASVKGDVEQALINELGEVPPWFVLGHPIAGSEKSGILASNPDLYEAHKVILTPVQNTDQKALALVASLWKALGAEVVEMPIDQHDKVLGATSHLPHLLAYTLVDCLQSLETNVDVFRFAAGGFRDFTRIAASDPHMWHDIMLANKSAILENLDNFEASLKDVRLAIEQDNSEQLLNTFSQAKASRDYFQQLLDSRKPDEK